MTQVIKGKKVTQKDIREARKIIFLNLEKLEIEKKAEISKLVYLQNVCKHPKAHNVDYLSIYLVECPDCGIIKNNPLVPAAF